MEINLPQELEKCFKMTQYSLKWSNQAQNHLNEKLSQCLESNQEA